MDIVKQILSITGCINLYDISNIDDTRRRHIAEKISLYYTNTYQLTEVLHNNIFASNYNFEEGIPKLLDDFYDKYEKEIKVSNLHYVYNEILERCCDHASLIDFLEDDELDFTSLHMTLLNSTEKKALDWKNKYYLYNNFSYDYKCIAIVNYYYMTFLNYLPDQKDLMFLYTIKETSKNIEDFKSLVINYIQSRNDYIYLEQCRAQFNALSGTVGDKTDGIKIMYYGAVGTSGYANITKNIIESLISDSRYDIYFSVLQFQNYNAGSSSELLSRLTKKRAIVYDYIIIHSTPEYFPVISKIERKINPNVIIYGITVWETTVLPKNWEFYCKFVDKISVPSTFSSLAFISKNISCDVVYHPIFTEKKMKDRCILYETKDKYKYIFYTINEWTNRKGIDDLIDVFLNVFGENKDYLLYLKTFGDISMEEGYKYINDVCRKKGIRNVGNILLDFDRVSDSYIQCIHECCDAYVSFTRSEGHGLGLCYSALSGNQVIVTNYSGHVEYLNKFKNVHYIDYKLIPATFCCTWSAKHSTCKLLPHCKYFDKFTPCNQKWAQIDKLHAETVIKKIGSYDRRKYEQNINVFTKQKFADDLYNSLINTERCVRKPRYINTVCKTIDYFPQSMYFKWTERRKKIGVLNCGAYGNVGDYSYSYIFGKLLKGDVIYINEHNHDNEDIVDIDYLIIGGGGLFNITRLNATNTIWKYKNYCKNNSIPYYIISVGFQDCDFNTNARSMFLKYGELMDDSQYISLRSTQDYVIASSVVKNETKEYMYVHSDLVYSLDKFIPYQKITRNILLVVLDDNWIKMEDKFIRNDINRRLIDNSSLELVFIDFAGIVENRCVIKHDLLKCYFSEYTVINGLTSHNREGVELVDIVNLLCRTDTIISGRLHSYILAKVYKVPNCVNYNYHNYKITADKISNLDVSCSLEPIIRVKNFIKHDSIFTSMNWTENERNTMIVKLNVKTNISIRLLQNWSNRNIEEALLL